MMDQARFVTLLGIAKNAGNDAGRRAARQLAVNVASEAGLSFDEAFAQLPEEDRFALGDPGARSLGAAVYADNGAHVVEEHNIDEADDEPDQAGAADFDETVHSYSSDEAPEVIEPDPAYLSTDAVPRDAIAAALAADPSRSDRDIARETGTSPTTVGRARAAAGFAPAPRVVHRSGTSYSMRLRREGETPA